MSDNLRGALLMVLGMGSFTFNDAFLKLVSDELPLFQALFLRGLATSVFFFVLARRMGVFARPIAPRDRRLVIWRTLAEAMAAFFFLSALFNMPLANVTAILQALPLAVTLAAAVFLGESVGWRRFLAIGVGFLGVMMIVRPGAEGFSMYSILALVAVGFVTVRDLVTRRMSSDVPSLGVAFAAAVGVTFFSALGSVTETWVRPSPAAWAALGGSVVFIIGGYLFSVMAMRVGELSFVAPFRYASLLFALVLGLAIFGDWPDTLTLLGAALVVSMGVFSFWRERRLAVARHMPGTGVQ